MKNRSNLTTYITNLHKYYKPKSAKRKIASLKAFFSYLEYEEFLPENPFSKIKVKFQEPVPLPRTIPTQNIQKLFQTAYQLLTKAILSCAGWKPLQISVHSQALPDTPMLPRQKHHRHIFITRNKNDYGLFYLLHTPNLSCHSHTLYGITIHAWSRPSNSISKNSKSCSMPLNRYSSAEAFYVISHSAFCPLISEAR